MSALNAINLSRFFLKFIPQDPDPDLGHKNMRILADPDPQPWFWINIPFNLCNMFLIVKIFKELDKFAHNLNRGSHDYIDIDNIEALVDNEPVEVSHLLTLHN